MKPIVLLLILICCLGLNSCKKITTAEYNIDRTSCDGCGECVRSCPHDAIYLDANGKAVIDKAKCNQCGNCVLVCPNNAIY